MVHDDYMLMLGANIYANPTYTVLYQADRNTENRDNPVYSGKQREQFESDNGDLG